MNKYTRLRWFISQVDTQDRPIGIPTDEPAETANWTCEYVALHLEASNLVAVHIEPRYGLDWWRLLVTHDERQLRTPQLVIGGIAHQILLFQRRTLDRIDTDLRGVRFQTSGVVILPMRDSPTLFWLHDPEAAYPLVLPSWLDRTDADWMERLSHHEGTNNRKLLGTLENALLVLQNTPEWQGVLVYDEFAHTYVWLKDAPHCETTIPRPRKGEVAIRNHSKYLVAWIRHYGIRVQRDDATLALMRDLCSRAQHVHPLREHLKRLPTWDGKSRLNDWLIWACGAKDTKYNRIIGSMWLRAAVARALNPGAPGGHMLALIGRETKLRPVYSIIGGPFALDVSPTEVDAGPRGGAHVLSTNDRRMQTAARLIRGYWIIWMHDGVLRRRYNDAARSWLTRKNDHFSQNVAELGGALHPRHCVMGTVIDSLSSIHYSWTRSDIVWPVVCGVPDTERLALDRDQLLAEAVVAVTNANPDDWTPSRKRARAILKTWTAPLRKPGAWDHLPFGTKLKAIACTKRNIAKNERETETE